jgi:hypothetical protein
VVAPRTKRRIAFALVALVLSPIVVVLGLPGMRTRLQVSYLAFRLGSVDPAVRDEAALRLLAIGRPAIDEVYPRLVATYVAHMALDPDAAVLTAHVIQRDRVTGNRDVEPEVVIRQSPNITIKPGALLEVVGSDPTEATKVFSPESTRRELLVLRPARRGGMSLGPGKNYLTLAMAVDDDLAPAVLSAVTDVLSR